MTACNEPTENMDPSSSEPATEEITNGEDTYEELRSEVTPHLSDFIRGKWRQTGKNCNSQGSCQPMEEDIFWNFDGSTLTWSSFSQPYRIYNDQILLGEIKAPYEIVGELLDHILLHSITTDTYLTLERLK